MKINRLTGVLLTLASLCTFISCEEDSTLQEEERFITNSISATIAEVNTRANFSWNDDWTRSNFSEGDKAGLFSTRGNYLDGYGAGGFYNEEMTYNSENANAGVNQFTNENIQINTYQLYQGNTIMYLPYCEQIQNPGLELRTLVDGTYRCKDFFMSYERTYNRGVFNARFIHQFCVVIVARGEGFDNPKRLPEDSGDPYEINFVLNKGVSHVRYASTPSYWQPYPDLVYQNGYVPEGATEIMTEEQCRKWQTWEGGTYNGKRAWYTLLPTTVNVTGAQARTKIDYIEIWDNFGNLQKISSFSLGEATDRTIFSANVCPLLVKMEELGPTIYPYPIEPWNQDQDITIKRSSGINSETQYNLWVSIYNNYIDNGRSESYEEQLKAFGDKINGVWNFNILVSLNGQNLEQIKSLQDILDGRSNVLDNGFYKNNVISNMNITKPLIAKIDGGGFKNLDFENITLKTGDNNAVGIIASEIAAASFENCIIDASISGNGPVGLISGYVKDCNINKCYFSGFLIGSSSFNDVSSYSYLFGNQPTGNINIQDSDNRSIIFSSK